MDLLCEYINDANSLINTYYPRMNRNHQITTKKKDSKIVTSEGIEIKMCT